MKFESRSCLESSDPYNDTLRHFVGVFKVLDKRCANLWEEYWLLSLLARLESAYSLIWGAREIFGKSGGETLTLL